MDQPVSSFMTSPVKTVRADDTVEAVAEALRRNRLSFVPVAEAEDGAVIGIISASDILHFEGSGRDPKSVQAWQMCTYKPIAVEPDDPVSEVARIMIERQVHHVVVLHRQRLVGVVSALDFVRRFLPGAAPDA